MPKGHKGEIAIGAFWSLIGIAIISYMLPTIVLSPEEPQYPQEIPSNLRDLPLCSGDNALQSNEDSSFVPSGEEIKVNFGGIETVGGLWGGSAALLTITSPYNTTMPAETLEKSWIGDIGVVGSTTKLATPWLSVHFEIEDKYVHQWVNGRAEMSLTYPYEYLGGYTDYDGHIWRNISFFVITPDEARGIEAHNNWSSNVSNRVGFSIIVPIIFVIFVLPGVLLIRSAYNERKKNL